MTAKRDPADRDLLVQAQRGDAAAFETLIERHLGLIHSVAYARLRHVDSAEDLTQEVALRAFLNLQRIDPRGNVTAYLARIARNLAIDWLRRGQRASRLLVFRGPPAKAKSLRLGLVNLEVGPKEIHPSFLFTVSEPTRTR